MSCAFLFRSVIQHCKHLLSLSLTLTCPTICVWRRLRWFLRLGDLSAPLCLNLSWKISHQTYQLACRAGRGLFSFSLAPPLIMESTSTSDNSMITCTCNALSFHVNIQFCMCGRFSIPLYIWSCICSSIGKAMYVLFSIERYHCITILICLLLLECNLVLNFYLAIGISF